MRIEERVEPQLTLPYRKDPKDETFLRKLNSILAPFQVEEYRDLAELYPTLHIIGAPRSGTTPLSQLISAHLDVGYINNLIAAFWRAPLYGIRLSKKLMPLRMPSSFQSEFGQTSDIFEPHEFGYFWSSLLGYRDMLEQGADFEEQIDWHRLRLTLINMTHEFGHPVVFKSFLLGWHVAGIQAVLPKTCFVRIRRDPTQNAISILKMRRQLLGSTELWNGLKPAQYSWLKDQPYWRQVAGQVYYVERSVTQQIEKANPRTVLEVAYEELCRSPRRVLERVVELLAWHGSKVDIVSTPPESFRSSTEDINAKPEYRLVANAVRKFYGLESESDQS